MVIETNKFHKKIFSAFITIIICNFVFTYFSFAADITFSWTPNDERTLDGYRIYFGTSSNNYFDFVDVGLPEVVDGIITVTLSGLEEEVYYFAATAYDNEGFESVYSREIRWQDPANALVKDWDDDSTQVNIYGNVTYHGEPTPAMVLANGQSQFVNSGDGHFDLDVPLDSKGQITVYSFASGLAPYKEIIYPSVGKDMQIQMVSGYEGAGLEVSYLVGEALTNSSWVRLTGNITYEGSPICTMALANGQYMFTCSGDGSFDFEVPFDSNGSVTLYVFYSGLLPYKTIIFKDRVNIYGNITYHGEPLSAMVLANGQYQFVNLDDSHFDLDVPLDSKGQITVYSFASGLAPYKEIIYPSAGKDMQIQMAPGGEGVGLEVSYLVGEALTNSSWVRLTGNITYDGSPVCAMALANGQHMFTCSGDGSFDFAVPLDSNGSVTFYAFYSGLLPYKTIIPID